MKQLYRIVLISTAVIITAAGALFFTALPAFAVVGDVIVAKSGQPVPNATIILETSDGNQLQKLKTDSKGRAEFDLPEGQTGKDTVIQVKKFGSKTSKHTLTPKSGADPWSRISLDMAGGVATFTDQAVTLLKKAADPIEIGENAKVGSGARVKQKAKETAGNMIGGLLGGLTKGAIGLGKGSGSDDGSSEGSKPKLDKDPCPKKSKYTFKDPASGTEIAVGGKMTPDGLLISTTILKSPDKGTFQTVYLMDDEGKKGGPILYFIYALYREWSLTVSWTYDKWVNGKHVEHREGGWSDSGRDFLGTFAVPQKNDGIWKQMGFSNAVAGIKGLGTLFPVTSEMLRKKTMHLVIHISRPSQDIVTTIPLAVTMSPMSNGALAFLRPF